MTESSAGLIRTASAFSELESEPRGGASGETRFGVGSHAVYATDASNCLPVPTGVVTPQSADDRIAEVARHALCRSAASN